MTDREVVIQQRKIEKLFKSVLSDYKELKSLVYELYREVGVPLKMKKKLKAQVDFTLFNMNMDSATFSKTVKEIVIYLQGR